MLILKYFQMKSTFGWSPSNLTALLRQQSVHFPRLVGLAECAAGGAARRARTRGAVADARATVGRNWTVATGSPPIEVVT
jgi:hypothetical protein